MSSCTASSAITFQNRISLFLKLKKYRESFQNPLKWTRVELLFVSEVTNKTVNRGGCAKEEAFNFISIHKITTCYCGTDFCNAPGSCCKSNSSSYLFILFGIFVSHPWF